MVGRKGLRDSIRTYIPNEIHRRVKLYAADQNIPLKEAYTRLIDQVLDEEGKERKRISFLTPGQLECVEVLSKEMEQSFNNTARDLMDISILYMFGDLSFREVVAAALPTLLDKLGETRPDIALRIIDRYQRYEK